MKQQILKFVLVATCISPLLSLAQQPPTTVNFPQHTVWMRTPAYFLRMTLATAATAPDYKDLYYILDKPNLTTPSGLRIIGCETHPSLTRLPNGQVSVHLKVTATTMAGPFEGTPAEVESRHRAAMTLTDAQTAEIGTTLAQMIKTACAPTAALPAEQRAAKIKQLDGQIAAAEQRVAAIDTIKHIQTRITDPMSLVLEKLKQLRQDLQRLDMEQIGKETRRKALAEAVEKQKREADRARGTDLIAEELRKLVELRERELETTHRRFQQNPGAHPVYSQTEIAAGIQERETALAEARIRLAEREASLGKAGKGELLDRLADELAMVSVDLTDIELQIDRVRYELSLYNAATLDTKRLDELLAREPALGRPPTETVTPVRAELIKQLELLYSDRFIHKVADASVVPIPFGQERNFSPTTQFVPATP